jgi:hypothetical protein
LPTFFNVSELRLHCLQAAKHRTTFRISLSRINDATSTKVQSIFKSSRVCGTLSKNVCFVEACDKAAWPLPFLLAMTVSDILIIYLTFGAPIAVYKYLQSRDLSLARRSLMTAATFLFWIPAAVRIARLYISNAYFGDGFVSPIDLDSSDMLISTLRENVRSELVRVGAGVGMHDARETVDRYVGLTSAVRTGVVFGGSAHENLFEAAGRKKIGPGIHCMKLRNRRRLERHRDQSRKELLKLLANAPDSPEHATAVNSALKLARQLDDVETFERLRELKTRKAEVWNSELNPQAQSMKVAPAVIATGSLNGD